MNRQKSHRRRHSVQKKKSEHDKALLTENFIKRFEANDNRVLTLREWCQLNGFSLATGHRIIKSGAGPIITQLSLRRIGITLANNKKWQASRERAA
jgi:predicted DNA-binding transcriptional regulator AlpA